MQVQPYLDFNGRCEEAIAFYRQAIGAEVTMMMRFKDMPQPHASGMVTPDTEDKVMHASLRVGDSVVMASDGRCTGQEKFAGFALSLTVPDAAAAERAFASLGDGGRVIMPLGQTFFAPQFGMVTDRFGVRWMVMVAG